MGFETKKCSVKCAVGLVGACCMRKGALKTAHKKWRVTRPKKMLQTHYQVYNALQWKWETFAGGVVGVRSNQPPSYAWGLQHGAPFNAKALVDSVGRKADVSLTYMAHKTAGGWKNENRWNNGWTHRMYRQNCSKLLELLAWFMMHVHIAQFKQNPRHIWGKF